MSVLVIGMHRSGTSVLAAATSTLGLSTGRGQMMSSHADNPVGFWEVQALTTINEKLLAALGGNWRRPPTCLRRDRWWQAPELDSLRNEATKTLRVDRGEGV